MQNIIKSLYIHVDAWSIHILLTEILRGKPGWRFTAESTGIQLVRKKGGQHKSMLFDIGFEDFWYSSMSNSMTSNCPKHFTLYESSNYTKYELFSYELAQFAGGSNIYIDI